MTGLACAALACVLAAGATAQEQRAPVPGQRQSVSAQAYTHYLNGRIREQAGDFRGALEHYRMAVVYDAFSPYLHLVISDVHARLLNFKAAIAQAEAAVELDPAYVEGYLQLGLLFRVLGELEPAERAFQKAIQTDPKRIEGYTELSRVLLREKKEREAELVFEMMMTALPDNPTGYFEMGRAFFEKRMLEKAAQYLARAIDRDPSHLQASFTLAGIYEMQNRFSEATRVLERLQHYVSDDPDLMLALGRLSLKAGDEAGAERYFDHLRRFAWSEVDTRVRIAMTYLDEAWFDKAIAEMHDLIKAFPTKDAVQYYAARVYEGAKKYTKAITIYDAVAVSSEYYHDALVHGAFCRVKVGEAGKAITALAPYAETVDNPASLVFNVLSLAWAETERKAEGIAFFKKLLKNRPGWTEIAEALAGLQEKSGDTTAARATLNEAMAKQDLRREDRERLLISLAMLMERSGEPEKALGHAQEVLALNPDSPEALNFIGYTWADLGKNIKEAEEMVTRALLYKPDSGYVTDSLGWVYHRQGNFEKALKTLMRADRLAPDEPEINEHVAETLIKLNRAAEGKARLKKALELKPDERVKGRIEKRLRELEGRP